MSDKMKETHLTDLVRFAGCQVGKTAEIIKEINNELAALRTRYAALEKAARDVVRLVPGPSIAEFLQALTALRDVLEGVEK